MTKIMKFTVEVTVLIPSDQTAAFHQMDLATIAGEMDGGDFIGSYTTRFNGVVPADDVKDELFILGNDGSFFDHD